MNYQKLTIIKTTSCFCTQKSSVICSLTFSVKITPEIKLHEAGHGRSDELYFSDKVVK